MLNEAELDELREINAREVRLGHIDASNTLADLLAHIGTLEARVAALVAAGDALLGELEHPERCDLYKTSDPDLVCTCHLKSVWAAWRAARGEAADGE